MPAEKTPSEETAPVHEEHVERALKAGKIVDEVRKSVSRDAPEASTLFSELEALAQYIQDAKKEIAALSPSEVKEEFLPTATDQLDAIVEATADATHAIMDSTETIEEVTSNLSGESADALVQATTRIYEACGFQDLTGQRISKVVSTLKDIESKIDDLLEVFADQAREDRAAPAGSPAPELSDDHKLLNGPQSKDKAKSQAEIDALLADFD